MDVSSITVTGREQKQAWDDEVLPAVEKIRDGVWSIPVPFPEHPIRYTLSYLLTSANGCLLIDPGWASDEGWRHLTAGFASAGIGAGDIQGIVVTHCHADHVGLASRLREASGAWVAVGEHEVFDTSDDVSALSKSVHDMFAGWGVPDDVTADITSGAGAHAGPADSFQPDRRLADGSVVPVAGLRLRVVATSGHTPGHICLIDEDRGLIFSGDHVLPRITPNVSLQPAGPANPLSDYYESLEKLRGNERMEVCPAHEYRFMGVSRRVAELVQQSSERSDEVLEVASAEGVTTIWEIARRLNWSRGWDSLQGPSLRLALGETASHVAHLRSMGHSIELAVAR